VLETSPEDLKRLWQELGLAPGSVIYCHSFLPSLGKIKGGPGLVVQTILETLGPKGTLVVPTFTYSYFKDQVYDVESSPSTVGALGDLVRTWPGAVRNLEPNFSMAAVGARAQELVNRDIRHFVGPGSVYDKLMQADMRVLLLGVDFTALALFMHLEKLHQISYRYDKEFKGRTRHQGEEFEDTALHFVRDLDLNPITHRSRIGAVIDQQPDCQQVSFAYGQHRLVPATTVARVVSECLAKDPYFLIKDPVG
jgi:aminoglycoside 3-N-acetyltransferase